MSDPLEALFSTIPTSRPEHPLPYVTLSYAQSLDGSIAAESVQQLLLSSPESTKMTHRLRAAHDGILVGVNTILADDPQLTTRHGAGEHPRPIVLDTHLRTTLKSNILRHPKSPLLVCRHDPPETQAKLLSDAGAELLPASVQMDGRIDLRQLLTTLKTRGIMSIMVEGGAAVISSMLRERLVDACVITIAPLLVGGVQAVKSPLIPPLHLRQPAWINLGMDMVVWGDIEWSAR